MNADFSFAGADYRPACLRHKSATSVQQLRLAPPSPGSNNDVNWLGANSPWSATTERESRYDSSNVKGTVLPRSAWKVSIDLDSATALLQLPIMQRVLTETLLFPARRRSHHLRRRLHHRLRSCQSQASLSVSRPLRSQCEAVSAEYRFVRS